jgi:hypothetical protein
MGMQCLFQTMIQTNITNVTKKYLHKLSILFGWKLNRKVAALSKFGSGEENLKLI